MVRRGPARGKQRPAPGPAPTAWRRIAGMKRLAVLGTALTVGCAGGLRVDPPAVDGGPDADAPVPEARNDDRTGEGGVVDGAAPEVGGACTGGARNRIDPATGHCYMLSSTLITWPGARGRCDAQAPGAHLVTIESAGENALLAAFAAADVWIGASEEAGTNTWTWVDGRPLGYTNWDTGGPSGAPGRDCAMLAQASSRWVDASCAASYRFVCERD